LDAAKGDWPSARDHVQRSLKAEEDNLNARNLLALILDRTGNTESAETVRKEALCIDPLDAGARWSRGLAPPNGQQCLDLAYDLLRCGQREEALKVLRSADLNAQDGSAPMILLTIADVQKSLGSTDAEDAYERAATTPLDYSFPSRLEEMLVLQRAISAHENNWAANYLLGNLLYDKRRYEEAIAAWEAAAAKHPGFPIVYRNLGLAYFNIRGDQARSLEKFDQAFHANPLDARVLYERDQLWKRVGKTPELRLQELLNHSPLVSLRDDLSLELAMLYNQVGRPEDALKLLLERKFQPWEGGEGLVLTQYVRARLLLGRRRLEHGELPEALKEFEQALQVPENLSEAKHLLANQSDIYYWLGEASSRMQRNEAAASWWDRATWQKGDFQQMSVRSISDMTFWSALSYQRLGKAQEAEALFQKIYIYSIELEQTEPKIDYFATSLPAMLLFNEDLSRRNRVDALFLRAQACTGLGDTAKAERLLHEVLQIDGNHTGAADLLRQIGSGDQRVLFP
jgi:tetratricopeptide (TPR) repeat protein